MSRPLSAYISRLLLRNRLSKDEIAALLAIDAPLVMHSARRSLVRPGQRVTFACLVADGLVARTESFADGARRTTAIFVPSDMCDLHSVPVPVAGWGIEALTDCAIYQVPHDALLDVARRFPAIASAFWTDTIVDASILSKWISLLGGRSAIQRFAHLLCEYGRRMELAGLGQRDSFSFPVSQEQIGELLGVTSVHVNRLLRSLADRGLVSAGRKSVHIDDLAGLERLATYDDHYLLLDRPGR